MRNFVVFFFAIAFAGAAVAGDDPDGQIRLYLHLQRGESKGFAAWLTVIDATQRPRRVYAEAGYLVRKRDEGRVLSAEFLAGAFVHRDKLEPGLNVRLLIRRKDAYSVSSQLFHDLDARQTVLQFQTVADLPLKGWQAGLEGEASHRRGRTIAGIGPRVVYAFSPGVSVAIGYQFRDTRNVCRLYSGLNF